MPESAKKSFVIFTYVVLALSTLLVFWQVRNFDSINYDDNAYVYQNPHVLSGLTWDNLISAFTTAPAGGNWLPLTWLSFMLDCQLFGPKPGWMHLVNVLLHLANTLLLFAVLKKMTGAQWQSAFVAAAFALHPMHVESVAWITERKDVLSTFFLLLTLAAYVSYVRRHSTGRYLLAILLFALGLMAKPMLVTLPLLLLLLDYWPLNRFNAQSRYRIVAEKIPFFALAAVSSVITFMAQRAGGSVAEITMHSLHSRVANAFLSYAKYIGKMFWPENLAVFYPYDAGAIGILQVALCALLIIVVSVLVIRSWRKQKYLVVGWFWFLASLIPVIGLVQSGAQAMADRYTYIPYIGLFIMIAWGLPELLPKWPQQKTALGLSMAVVLTALGICAHRQVSYWSNSISLFSHANEVTKNNYLAYCNRGVAYIKLGRWQETIEAFGQAIKIKSNDAETHYNLGVAYVELGRGGEAVNAYTQAIKIKPDYAEAINNRGVAYGKLGRGTEAIEDFKEALKIKPDWAEASYNLANELAGQGRYDEALDQYRTALRLKSDWPACMNNLAFLIVANPQVKNRDTGEAIRLASRACELTNYKDPAFLDTLAVAYASAARFSEAVDTANKALALADAANQTQLKDIIQQHLSLFIQGKPCIEPAGRPLPDPNKL